MKLNPTDYILLAYLNNSPVYAYHLQEILSQESVDTWCQYSIPHLYYSLRRLEKHGLVKSEQKKIKSRPPQKIYSLTELGERAIREIKKESALIQSEDYFPFDLLIGLSEKLGIKNVDLARLIEQRIDFLRGLLAQVQADFRARELQESSISMGEQMAIKHRIRFLKNEIDFYRKSLKDLK